MYFSKKTPAQVIREIAKESETDEESDNELHLPEVNNNIATSMTQPDQLDNSPKDLEAIEKHSSKSKGVVEDSNRNQRKCKSKQWKWTPEMVDNLVKCLSNIKSQYELKGLDFESDYVALYTKAREAMAALYNEENFGPQKLAEMGDEADPNKCKVLITDQRKNMKTGHERVKQKACHIRQEYGIAVTQGTKSGSSRAVCENWEQLKILWGGSAASVCLTNCRTTILRAEKQSDFNNHDEMNECNEGIHDD